MDAFAELKPALSQDEALAEANRCLMCFDAPCTRACPTHIDVPAFIKKIATGNLRGSARTILSANILGASCARVCPTEVLCEGACVMNSLHHKPIEIGRLQRHATDALLAKDERLFAPPPKRTDRRVAIVGGGPAGLACATELSRLGVGAVVFDAAAQPGGLNTFGVAEYKLTPAFALREIAWVKQHGVEIRSGVTVGKDIPIVELEAEFAAVFIGVGLGHIQQLGVPGEDLAGVHDALAFIALLKTERERARPIVEGKRVVVIGGGNTAIDAVTQAARLGAAEVWLAYRRGEGDMSAYAHEVELARRAGCRIALHAAPVRILGATSVEGIELIRTRSEGGRTGRLELLAGTEHTLACDVVLKANGQVGHRAFLESLPGVELHKGRPIVNAEMQTTNPRYFAGGDCVSGGKEVVNAVAEGKTAAQHIAAMLLAGAVEKESA